MVEMASASAVTFASSRIRMAFCILIIARSNALSVSSSASLENICTMAVSFIHNANGAHFPIQVRSVFFHAFEKQCQ